MIASMAASSWPPRHPSRARRSPSCWPSSRRPSPGSINGIGVGVFRVHPLIMTLGLSLVDARAAMTVYQLAVVQSGTAWCPTSSQWLGLRDRRSRALPNSLLRLRAARGADHGRPALQRLRPAALRRRRQPGGRATVRRSRLAVLSACTSSRRCWPRSPASSWPGLYQDRDRDPRGAVRAARGGCLGHRRHVDLGRTRRVRRDHRGGLILTVARLAAPGAADAGGGPPGPVRPIIVAVAAAYTRVTGDAERPRRRPRRPATSASTWAARTSSGPSWSTRRRVDRARPRPGATARRGRRRTRSSVGSARRGGARPRSTRWPDLRTRRDRRPRAVRPGDRRDAGSS